MEILLGIIVIIVTFAIAFFTEINNMDQIFKEQELELRKHFNELRKDL